MVNFMLLWLASGTLGTAQRCSGRGRRQLVRLRKAFCPHHSLTEHVWADRCKIHRCDFRQFLNGLHLLKLISG